MQNKNLTRFIILAKVEHLDPINRHLLCISKKRTKIAKLVTDSGKKVALTPCER